MCLYFFLVSFIIPLLPYLHFCIPSCLVVWRCCCDLGSNLYYLYYSLPYLVVQKKSFFCNFAPKILKFVQIYIVLKICFFAPCAEIFFFCACVPEKIFDIQFALLSRAQKSGFFGKLSHFVNNSVCVHIQYTPSYISMFAFVCRRCLFIFFLKNYVWTL